MVDEAKVKADPLKTTATTAAKTKDPELDVDTDTDVDVEVVPERKIDEATGFGIYTLIKGKHAYELNGVTITAVEGDKVPLSPTAYAAFKDKFQ